MENMKTAVHQLKNHKDSDRRVAQLGLAASGSDLKQTGCLSAEQMACLVDGSCPPEEQQLFLEHLADCEGCYRWWLETHSIVAAKQKGRGRVLGFRRARVKNFAWIGSALAAAASVVLYLNISRESGQMLYRSEVMEKSRVESSDTVGENAVFPEKKAMEKDGQPVEDESPGPPTVKQKRSPSGLANRRKRSVPAEAGAPPPGRAVFMERAQEPEEGAMARLQALPEQEPEPHPALNRWLESVRQRCRAGEDDMLLWQQQLAAGKQLLDSLDPEEKKTVIELLALMEELEQGTGNTRVVCKRILERIRESRAGSN